MKTQQKTIARRLIEASSKEQVLSVLNGLTYEDGIEGVRKAIDQTEEDIEFFLEEGYHSLASSKASLLSILMNAEERLLQYHGQAIY